MRIPSTVRTLLVTGVLGVSATLLGCAQQSEMASTGPGTLGQVQLGQAAPTPPPAHGALTSPGTPQTPTPVALPALPADRPVTPAPVVGTSPFLRDIFFDYDRSLIRDDQKPALEANILWLKAEPRALITIEGYCDERGSIEYNKALSERRVNAVRDYLVAGGIPAERITMVTYGKERPFVLGHDDPAWSLNRRARLVVMTTEPAH